MSSLSTWVSLDHSGLNGVTFEVYKERQNHHGDPPLYGGQGKPGQQRQSGNHHLNRNAAPGSLTLHIKPLIPDLTAEDILDVCKKYGHVSNCTVQTSN